jgi:ADP-heptose:LPS heptosyltransferase
LESDVKKAKKILVFRTGQLGDTIVALPAIWAVREYFPEADITMLSDYHPRKAYVMAEDFFPKSSLINNYISYEANEEGIHPTKLIKLLPKFRRYHFDLLVYLAPRMRTNLQILRDLFFFRIAGIRKFIGHHGIEPLPLGKDGNTLPCVEHEADHLLSRLSNSGIPVPKAGAGCMDLKLSKEERQKAKQFIAAHLNPGNFDPLVCFGSGSKWPSKIWPKERYAEVGQQLISYLSISPFIIGGIEDRVVGDWLIAKWGKGVNIAGMLTVRETAAILECCRMYIGNDTGAMHLAAAVGTPCVAIFSAQDWPGRWYPYGNKNIVLRNSVPCEGCKLKQCNNNSLCLKKISIESVTDACKKLIEVNENKALYESHVQ